ncbi:hypothetical protein ACH4D5_19355 [Streptomyces sp. NPDC018029]|uniref:hypothetical protein n=1 Tax=Streptomyces sp. NPDC018029 TaxID=3365032 RepID=UPI0037B478E2
MRYTRRARSLLVAAVVVAGACTLTACQENDADTKAGTASTTVTTDAGNSADDDSAADDGAADDSVADDGPAGGGAGVSGTFAGGTVEYLAPEKYIVSADGKEQQFYVARSTGVYGAGVLCGEHSTRATTRCFLAELESSTKSGSVAADVVLRSGVATRITERAAPDEGAAVDDQ